MIEKSAPESWTIGSLCAVPCGRRVPPKWGISTSRCPACIEFIAHANTTAVGYLL